MIINNYKFNYRFIGNKDKPLILFLHGFMGNTHEFESVISLLINDFYCLTVDLPGHGKTQILGGDECYKMANTAQALISLLDNLVIKKCFLVGYSMGGRLALYLSLNFSDRFPKVVLESASPGLATAGDRAARITSDNQIATKLARTTEKSDFLTFLNNWYKQPIFGRINQHPNFDKMIANRLQNHPIELAQSLRLMGTGCQPSLWEKLSENTNPLFLLVGVYDEKFIVINKEIAQICPHAQLEIISHAGHNIHFENPQAFVERVRIFLGN